MKMKLLWAALVCAAASHVQAAAPGETWEPKAADSAEVRCGAARFTVLTDRLIRMEYSPGGNFDDRATLTFVNRRTPTVDFRCERSGKGVTIDTGRVRLVYEGGAFAPETLSANGDWGTWRFGKTPIGNLYGTKRTLDGVKDRQTLKTGVDSDWGRGGLEPGLMSREGWAVVDDTMRHVFEPTKSHWRNWVAERQMPEGYRDLYLFAYGRDFRGCLADYTKVAGRIPLPPKWTLGYWWSRYWLYSDREVKELASEIREAGIPLDVFILDMEWHETWGIGFAGRDEFGQPIGWTGYTWNRRLFPDPKGLMDWFHERGIRSGANLHPASGVQPMEACYRDFCRDYGWAKTNAVPYRMTEQKWADSYFKTVLGPIEAQGMDFWWLDWQQWPTSKYVKDLSNTFWLNHTFNQHAAERDGGKDRPLIYHRWGGLGSHRYQVGFSGDCKVSWDVLELLPWFTATAANVGYGYWGHDIGGHCHPENGAGTDPDLYLRWLQSGVFTPIFKTHSTKSADIERRAWKYPTAMGLLREAIRLRYRLAPYVYTAARQAYDTGVSICRPMYYEWSESEEAYAEDLHQLMFGDDILAGTVCRPMDAVTRLSPARFWFPQGRWFDMETGAMIEGGRYADLSRTAAENPWFVRAGAILPLYPEGVMSLQQADATKMALVAVPGAKAGKGSLYEDGATDSAYDKAFATTAFAQREDGNRLLLTIGARQGKYEGMPARRTWEIRLPNRMPPRRVTVNGRETVWEYRGDDLTLVFSTGEVACGEKTEIAVEWSAEARADEARLAGKRGFLRRCLEVGEALKPALTEVHWAANVPNSYLDFSQLGSMLSVSPARAHELLDGFDCALAAFPDDFASFAKKIDPKVLKMMEDQLGLRFR